MLAWRGVSREWYLNSLHKRGSILPPFPPSTLAPCCSGGRRLTFGRRRRRSASGGNIRRWSLTGDSLEADIPMQCSPWQHLPAESQSYLLRSASRFHAQPIPTSKAGTFRFILRTLVRSQSSLATSLWLTDWLYVSTQVIGGRAKGNLCTSGNFSVMSFSSFLFPSSPSESDVERAIFYPRCAAPYWWFPLLDFLSPWSAGRRSGRAVDGKEEESESKDLNEGTNLDHQSVMLCMQWTH